MTNRKGFTLVELAIVLVIIGLLVGGVLQGQELIHQAQLRRVQASIRDLDTAVNTFRSKYDNNIPGDYARAAEMGLNDDVNGTVTAAVTADGVNPVTDTTGGNGDGDGILESAAGGNATVGFDGEIANFIINLSNMGVLQGTFNATTQDIGAAYPRLEIGGGMVGVTNRTLNNRIETVIGVGPDISTNLQTAGELIGNALPPEDAASIDTKLDDGVPDTGSVQTISAYSAVGAFTAGVAGAGNCNIAGAYNGGNQTNLCTLRIRAAS